ncbi:MAG: hypothetical protein ACRCYQ_11690 [Nocardioides sp.]
MARSPVSFKAFGLRASPSPATLAKHAKRAGLFAVKYGPQAKILWDRGGKQAASAGLRRAADLAARSRAFRRARGLADGSVLAMAPAGATVYVVFSGERVVAVYPRRQAPLGTLPARPGPDRADLGRQLRIPRSRSPRPRRVPE